MPPHNLPLKLIKCITLYIVVFSFCVNVYAECPHHKIIWDSLDTIENNSLFSPGQKLKNFYDLKKLADNCTLVHDSVYARILLKIGLYEVFVNKNYDKAINYTNDGLQINISNQKGSSKLLATRCYFNMAKYYESLDIFSKALNYYDSTIAFAKTFPDTTMFIFYSRIQKAYILFQTGDYQKAIEESISGMNYSLQKKDSSYFLAFSNQKAQSLYFKNDLSEALSGVNIIIPAAKNLNELFELGTALKTKAFILEKKGNFSVADSLFKQSIKTRILTEDYQQIATDYNDYANFYLDSLHDYVSAKRLYTQSIFYGNKLKDSIVLARANINIGEIYSRQKNYTESSNYCVKALKYLNFHISDISKNPTADQLNLIGAKELVLVIMNHKIETLLELFLESKNKEQLYSCLKTALVTDTLLSKMRNTQSGNESKLYWRNKTREFYSTAIEASYLANDPELAFYFMEKSRAVLLNDKLNELDASSYLSKADAARQEGYQIKIVELEQRLSALTDTSRQYQTIQLQLINTRNEFEQFIKSLEQKYPAYYQYKYADAVPSLKELQNYLTKNDQSFVHYFLGDTVTYILAVTSTNTKFIRLSEKDFNKDQLEQFLQLCTNKELLNNHYDSFAVLSGSIYKKIFRDLLLPKGRVIICADNIVIPFEALCSDDNGRHFLLNDYSFSYVYSARSLMKQFNNPVATGSFLGFAPVSFAQSLGVADLKNASEALHASAAYYKNDKLFTHQSASRSNFFYYASSYSIVSIFSHARADTTDNEPVLFMQDSVIHLSELQLLNNPATKLVLLSACQTNVGKAATGEGIYSLARGFATAGIPSVAATLWKADEQTIYAISEKFNQYLSEGMNKDEALQKAKLYFIQHNNSEKSLPYYWANMIVIGNTDTIHFAAATNNYWWWIIGCFAFVAAIVFFWKKVSSKRYNSIAKRK